MYWQHNQGELPALIQCKEKLEMCIFTSQTSSYKNVHACAEKLFSLDHSAHHGDRRSFKMFNFYLLGD